MSSNLIPSALCTDGLIHSESHTLRHKHIFMKKQKMVSISLVHALAVTLYTLVISWVLMNGENWFGQMSSLIGPTLMLLLLVISATITGGLVLGRPLMMYLDNQKKDGVRFLCFTVGWLAAIAIVMMLGLAMA